jgi:hypothetical protein
MAFLELRIPYSQNLDVIKISGSEMRQQQMPIARTYHYYGVLRVSIPSVHLKINEFHPVLK